MREWLLEGFRYDRWANGLWLETLKQWDAEIGSESKMAGVAREAAWPDFSQHDPRERASEILAHIFYAQRTWLSRCGHQVDPGRPDAEGWLEALNTGWTKFLSSADPDDIIQYKTYAGTPFSHSVRHIALHVINHGTYHRGQLRELMEGTGVNLPMTDLVAFARPQ